MNVAPCRRLLALGLAPVVTLGVLLAIAAPADAAACTGVRTWTGAAGDNAWTTDNNWNPPGDPSATDAVHIDTSSANVTGATGTICDLSLAGTLTVSNTLTVSEHFSAAGTAVLSFGDAAGLTLPGQAHFATGARLTRPTGASGITPQVRIGGTTAVDGTLTTERVGIVLGAGGSLISGTVAGQVSGSGTLSWQGGTLGGLLTIGTPLVLSGTGDRTILATSGVTLAGNTTLSGSRMLLGLGARVTVTGTVTLTGSGVGFGRSTAGVDGQALVIDTGGLLQRSGAADESAVLDLPVTNRGSVTVAGQLSVPLGYVQDKPDGVALDPVTGLLSRASTLTTERPDGSYGTLRILAGGIGGVGHVAARRLDVGDGWVHPGFAQSSGTLTLHGDLRLSPASEVQLYIRGRHKHDLLQVLGLTSGGTQVAAGRATLAGRIAALTGPDYDPSYGTRIRNVVTYAARTGDFGKRVRPITASGLGWAPSYDDRRNDGDGRGVDVRLLDVAPPTVGLAGVPAFTAGSSQRLTYDAVDNRSGVRSFDVRWRKGATSRKYSSWHHPRAWRKTTDRTQNLRGLDPGWTYCFAVRATDGLGNRSRWSTPQCVARLVDDDWLRASAGWSRPPTAGAFGGSLSRTTLRGAELTRRATFSRVALTVVRCPKCGRLGVYSGDMLVKTLDLRSRRTRATTWVSKPLAQRRSLFTLRVLSAGRLVAVDALGLSR